MSAINDELHPAHDVHRPRIRIPLWIGFLGFLLMAVVLLWGEHKSHLLGALPFAFVLLCPLLHLLMHRGHGGHGGHGGGHDGHRGHHQKGDAS